MSKCYDEPEDADVFRDAANRMEARSLARKQSRVVRWLRKYDLSTTDTDIAIRVLRRVAAQDTIRAAVRLIDEIDNSSEQN